LSNGTALEPRTNCEDFSKRLFHYLETRTILLSHPIKIDTAEFNCFFFLFFVFLLLFSCSFFLLLRFAYHGLVWVTIFEPRRWLSLDGCKFFSSTSVLFVCLFVCLFVFRVFSPYITFPFLLSLFLKEKERKKDV